MTEEDARSLPGAAQAALRNRAVQAVLDGMTQAEAARVFRVHPNAVNRWVKRYREGGFPGLAEQRRGRRTDRPALWPLAGAHDRGWISAWLGVQPAAAAAPGPGAEPGRGAPLAGRDLSRHPRPGSPGGWSGVVAGRDGRALGCGGWTVMGAGRPDPGHQADRQAVQGQHDQRRLQRRDAAVPAVCGVVQRPGIYRLPAAAAARLRRAEGAPDRGWASGPPRQAGQRLD